MNKGNVLALGMLSIILAVMLVLVPTQTQASQVTPSPSPSPTATTTALPNIQLPAWMHDPNTDVMTLPGESGGVVFVNAKTDERFTLKLPYIYEVAWVSAEDGVYL